MTPDPPHFRGLAGSCVVDWKQPLKRSDSRLLRSAPQLGQRERIAAILSKSYDTDEPELAAKHNEHQPLANLNQNKGMTTTKLDLTSGGCC